MNFKVHGHDTNFRFGFLEYGSNNLGILCFLDLMQDIEFDAQKDKVGYQWLKTFHFLGLVVNYLKRVLS